MATHMFNNENALDAHTKSKESLKNSKDIFRCSYEFLRLPTNSWEFIRIPLYVQIIYYPETPRTRVETKKFEARHHATT